MIQHVLIFYLLLKLSRISILLIFFKELFNSSIFSREETLKIINKKISIFIRTSPFQVGNNYYANSKDIDLPIRTSDSITLIKQALTGLKSIYKEGYRYQKTGIIFSGLRDADVYSKNLFSTINNDKKRIKLMQAIDNTNIKYGRGALSIAQARLKKKMEYQKTVFFQS